MIFDRDSSNAIVIMYPTGGYGNFLYYLLSEFFDNTVKVDQSSFEFNQAGNSHAVKKYTQIFSLGRAYYSKTLRDFSYDYQLYDLSAQEQINAGKKFVVLGDVGNLGDNVIFVRKYFPKATIVRVYADSFDEKLILWANTVTKSNDELIGSIYKDSLHTTEGIAKFSNKSIDQVNDTDAINCMLNFFQNNFAPYGNFFNKPHADVINIKISQFFNVKNLSHMCDQLAQQLNLSIIHRDRLDLILFDFVEQQKNFKLLTNSNTLTGQAVKIWRDK